MLFSTLLIVLPITSAPAQDHPAGHIESQLLELETSEGQTLEADAIRLWVPENRSDPESRTISLAMLRLASTADEPGPPLIFLHGGPGGSATGAAQNPRALTMWAAYLDLGDVILLDQRGCGRSKPALARPLRIPPPTAAMHDMAANEMYLLQASRAVAAELAAEGLDITGYTTEENADDVDAVRQALGAETMRLLGFSYGTHLGLSVIRRHGERVASAVLIGVEGPDETKKLPVAYTTLVKKISAMVAADPVVGEQVPDFEALLERVLQKLEREPLEVEVTQPVSRETVTVPVGPSGLRWILVRDIGDTSDLPVFPRLLHSIEQGDPSVLAWFVQKRYGMSNYPTHAFTMDPASGCSTEREARILREAQDCILGNAMNFGSPAIDAVWQMPVLSDEFRSPLVTDVRTLFLSGTLDANTPPYQAERMRWGFVDSVHLVQRNGGHESWMGNPKVPAILHDFFAGQDVAGRDVDLPPLRFIPVEGDAEGHPSLR